MNAIHAIKGGGIFPQSRLRNILVGPTPKNQKSKVKNQKHIRHKKNSLRMSFERNLNKNSNEEKSYRKETPTKQSNATVKTVHRRNPVEPRE